MNEMVPAVSLLNSVGRDICLRGLVFPLNRDPDGIVRFAAANPRDETLRAPLRLRLGAPVDFVAADAAAVEAKLATLGAGPGSAGLLSDLIKSEVTLSERSSLEEIRHKSQSEPVIKLVNNLMNQAIAESATDIHIEPGEEAVKARFRKDGLLKDAMDLPKWVQASLVSRIKILANLDIAEKRLPQDGRIRWPHEGDPVDMRVSTLPTRAGEKVVIRILRHLDTVSSLDALGMPPDVLQAVRHIVQ